VVAAPSGGGKTSLIAALLEQDPRVRLSVSHTTRPPRPGEQDGIHYHFVDEETFTEMIGRGMFLEHAQVFDNRYGTTREAVQHQLAAGYDVVLDIDWQGARQVRESFPDSRTIFIVPPSILTLRERLAGRGQDDEAVIARRMRDARSEISHWDEFDHVIVNDDFASALAELHSLIRGDRADSKKMKAGTAEILAELLETG
jgi:guanylate kinase